MSSKPNKTKKAAPADVPHDELWRSGRSRFDLNQFRFGRDRKWHFSGQQPDETVTQIFREHWWFLVLAALPLFVALIVFILVVWASVKLANPLWPIFELIAVILIIAALAWFICERPH